MSSTANSRFTAYLSPRERELLTERAEAEGCSANFLVRTGIRLVLGLPVPARVAEELRRQLEDLEDEPPAASSSSSSSRPRAAA